MSIRNWKIPHSLHRTLFNVQFSSDPDAEASTHAAVTVAKKPAQKIRPASQWAHKVLPFIAKANPQFAGGNRRFLPPDSIHIFCGQLCGCFGEKRSEAP